MQLEKIDPVNIKNQLNTSFIGREIHYYEKIDSTNKIAKDFANKNANEGALFITEEQTKGRGRLNRNWQSQPYSNILMSLIFRPALHPSKIFSLTMISSIALVNAIMKMSGLTTKIKWPNDIYYNNKKLAGILTELKADKNKVSYAIVGIGLNVNSDLSEDPALKDIATSLYNETGKIISRNELLIVILSEIEQWYNSLNQGRFEDIRREWNDHSLVLGKPVVVYSDNYKEEGIALSIADDGSLIIQKNNGEQKKIICGDVSLRLKDIS
jgi:BirA family transcriptional regulator, biotin operon repressor / biotin---[acetyl-CoA-carboxylase] ligase